MDETTIARLNALNREFYRAHATSFDAKRRSPWQGWERVASLVPPGEHTSILDVGCGNARFGLFLERHLGRPIDYFGVDASRELLALAAERVPRTWRLVEADLVSTEPPQPLDRTFDLVVSFGFIHHVPGEETRRRLLATMARRVAPGGYLAVSFWQFGHRDRFTDRAQDWSAIGLPAGAVERHDFLLPWGEADEGSGAEKRPLRYCHFVDPTEARRLVTGLELDLLDEFRSDGRTGDLNLYFVLQR